MTAVHARSPEAVIARVVDPGEHTLWTGQPDIRVMISGRRRRLWLRLALAPIVLGGMAWFVARMSPAVVPGSVRLEHLLQPRFLLPSVVLLLGIPALALFTGRRFERWVHSLAYAITDRRLLIVEGERIVDDYAPEQVAQVVVVARGRRHGDVIFGRRPSNLTERTRDPVQRERDRVGFKALPDAATVQAKIESWLAEHLRAAELLSTGASDAGQVVASAGEPSADPGDANGGPRRITHDGSGLRIGFPQAWRVRVRTKKKPVGRIFLDREQWQAADDARGWNVVRAEGTMRCAVEVEVFETAPTVTFESLSGSRLADAAVGPVVEAQPLVEIDSFRGFAVTRRRDAQVDERGVATLAGVVLHERQIVLHDGRRQIFVRATWPEDSAALADAVDAIVRSIRLE